MQQWCVSTAPLKISFKDCTDQKIISYILKIWRKSSEPKTSKLTYINLLHIAEIYVSFYYQSFLIPTASPNLNAVN